MRVVFVFVATTTSVVFVPSRANPPPGIPPFARYRRASTKPSGPRAPASILPSESRTSPKAFTTARALTTTSPRCSDQVPIPLFIIPSAPRTFPTVAPVPAPTEPSATSVPAASHASYPASPSGHLGSPNDRSKMTAPGTIGTTPTPTSKPRPRSANHLNTPSAAPRP